MKKNFFLKTAIIISLFVNGALLNAQVTIGSNKTPEPFSLLELISNETRGLRLPQITTAERDAMEATPDFQAKKSTEALGLQIFNTTTKCVETWNGVKWIGQCAPVADPCAGLDCSVAPAVGNITTWTNVMYDFQTQQLEAYGNGGGDVVNYQWQVSTSSNPATFTNIAGAPNSAFYTIPANFTYGGSDSLFFRCVRSNPMGDIPTNLFNMLFIKTNTPGYGIQNGNHYLTLQKGANGNNTNTTSGTIKMGLINLGATNDNNLGDFYQWGRIADGHQKIGWAKDADKKNIFGAGTSTAAYTNFGLTETEVNSNGQVIAPAYVDKFLCSTGVIGEWGLHCYEGRDRWGNHIRIPWGYTPVSLSEWSDMGQANNPCPDGWRIPSWNDYKDIINGNGSNDGTEMFPSLPVPFAGVNSFRWREGANGAAGGIIITNASGERLFFPASGYREAYNSEITGHDSYISFWSSSSKMNSASSWHEMICYDITISQQQILYGPSGFGSSVRCVAEEESSCTPVTPSVTISASPAGAVSGTWVTFSPTPTNGGTAPTYEWLLDGQLRREEATFSEYLSGGYPGFSPGAILICKMTSSDPCANPKSVRAKIIITNPLP